jgi:hypothetical protein
VNIESIVMLVSIIFGAVGLLVQRVGVEGRPALPAMLLAANGAFFVLSIAIMALDHGPR